MNRYITAIICMAFTMQTFAQKVFVVHKKDGTRIEAPVVSNIHFTGKAQVNDNEYTSVEVNVTNDVESGTYPYAEFTLDNSGLQEYGNIPSDDIENFGILYSITPGITLDNGTFITPDRQGLFAIKDLNFNTTYYYRSYVVYKGETYYSSEQSFTTEKPTMRWYVTSMPDVFLTEKMFVYPSEEAWQKFIEKYSLYFELKETIVRDQLLEEQWCRFMNMGKAKELATKCTQKYDCRDGVIYLLDEIGDDFLASFDNMECVMYGTVGLVTDEEYTRYCEAPDTIVCAPEFNVPDNTYYKFRPTSNTNPRVTYAVDQLMLANQEYELEIIMAPDTEVEEASRLPNIIRIEHLFGGNSFRKSSRIEDDLTTDPQKCMTYTYTITPTEFGKNAIRIESQVTTRNNGKTATRIMRIAKITVRKVKKEM